MIKSSRKERDAILHRLQIALQQTDDADLQATINALEDLNDLEKVIVDLGKFYEHCLLEDYAERRSPVSHFNKKATGHTAFFNRFNTLMNLCIHHPDIKNMQINTHKTVALTYGNNVNVVRGYGPDQAVGIIESSSGKSSNQSIPSLCSECGASYKIYLHGLCRSCWHYKNNTQMQQSQAQVAALQKMISHAQQTLSKPVPCKVCKKDLTDAEVQKNKDVCTSCLSAPLSKLCTMCKTSLHPTYGGPVCPKCKTKLKAMKNKLARQAINQTSSNPKIPAPPGPKITTTTTTTTIPSAPSTSAQNPYVDALQKQKQTKKEERAKVYNQIIASLKKMWY